jgi:hypothetical protein
LFGEKPSLEEIKNMYANRFKGMNYQRRRGNIHQGDQQGPLEVPHKYNRLIRPNVEIPQCDPSTNNPLHIKLDVTSLMSNAKVPIPIAELENIPFVIEKIKEFLGL